MPFGKPSVKSVTPWSFEGNGFMPPSEYDQEKRPKLMGYVGLTVLYKGNVIGSWVNWEVNVTDRGGMFANPPSHYYGVDEDGEHIRADSFELIDETAMKLAANTAQITYKVFGTGEEANPWEGNDVEGGPVEDEEAPF